MAEIEYHKSNLLAPGFPIVIVSVNLTTHSDTEDNTPVLHSAASARIASVRTAPPSGRRLRGANREGWNGYSVFMEGRRACRRGLPPIMPPGRCALLSRATLYQCPGCNCCAAAVVWHRFVCRRDGKGLVYARLRLFVGHWC